MYLNIQKHQTIRKLQKKRLKLRTDDFFLLFASDDVIPGKHNQTAY